MTEDAPTIERNSLIVLVVVFCIGTGLAVGMAVTPYVHGEPLLLTPENVVLKGYLDDYEKRVALLEKDHAALSELLAPSRPGASAKSVFALSTHARDAQNHLNDLTRHRSSKRGFPPDSRHSITHCAPHWRRNLPSPTRRSRLLGAPMKPRAPKRSLLATMPKSS